MRSPFARSRQAPCCLRRIPRPFGKSGATRIHIRNLTWNRSARLLEPYSASLPRSELSLLMPLIQQPIPVPVLGIAVDHAASYLTALLGRIGLSFQISGARDSKAAPLLTMPASSVCLPPTSVVATGSHFSYSDAPSSGAITGLSYPAICPGCPEQYQVFQLSPRTPDASRHPQQPTSGDLVIPFRAPPNVDFHHFDNTRVYRVATAPVFTSPNLARNVRIGSNRGISPRSARRSRTSLITGIRLQQRLGSKWRFRTWSGGCLTSHTLVRQQWQVGGLARC